MGVGAGTAVFDGSGVTPVGLYGCWGCGCGGGGGVDDAEVATGSEEVCGWL